MGCGDGSRLKLSLNDLMSEFMFLMLSESPSLAPTLSSKEGPTLIFLLLIFPSVLILYYNYFEQWERENIWQEVGPCWCFP
jgi:hypothetical protein